MAGDVVNIKVCRPLKRFSGLTANRHEENRFYSTGMLQAVMLDRLMPAWKNEAFNKDVYLENLLKKAVNNY